jgi:uncharacterized membrane protein
MPGMLPSRKIAAAFVGVFLIGAIVGGLLVFTLQDMRLSNFLTHTSDPKTMAARLNQKYAREENLTADEQARIAPLTQDMAGQLYQLRRRFGLDIIATLDDYHQRIGAEMTPEHRRLFDQANEQRKKRMSAMLLLDPAPADPK